MNECFTNIENMMIPFLTDTYLKALPYGSCLFKANNPNVKSKN